MPPISRRAKQLKKAREARAQKLKAKKNDKRIKINEIVDKTDEFMLDNTLELATRRSR